MNASKIHRNCPAELRAPTHKRAKHAALLSNKPLVDFVSDAVDRCARRVLKRHGAKDPVPDEQGDSVSLPQ